MYFQTAFERRPQPPDWNVITRDQRQQELLSVGQRVAQELNVKEVRYQDYHKSYVGITFYISPVKGQCNYASDDDGHYYTIPVDDFDPLNLDIMKAKLKWNPPYEVDVGGVSHNLETGVMHLRVSVAVGEEETLVYRGRGTYEELKEQGLVRKVGESYAPLPNIVLSKHRERTTKTRGFLGFGQRERQETIYEAKERTIEPVKAHIGVSADGSVSVDGRFLQNENVQRALDIIVEELFGLDIKTKTPVS